MASKCIDRIVELERRFITLDAVFWEGLGQGSRMGSELSDVSVENDVAGGFVASRSENVTVGNEAFMRMSGQHRITWEDVDVIKVSVTINDNNSPAFRELFSEVFRSSVSCGTI